MVAGAVPKGRARGKSGLRRAGCRVTPGEGDFKESATEIDRREHFSRQGWKGEVRAHRPDGNEGRSANPIRSNTVTRKLSGCPPVPQRWLEPCSNTWPG